MVTSSDQSSASLYSGDTAAISAAVIMALVSLVAIPADSLVDREITRRGREEYKRRTGDGVSCKYQHWEYRSMVAGQL